MGIFFNADINTLFVGGSDVSAAYIGNVQVWPVGLPSGTVFNFEYTGTVQSVDLPRGRYKLQCWGAQGGTSYGSSNGIGSKGGYSEGVLTLTKNTTLYIFVGGQGSRGSNTSLINGGWNGGGASVGYSSYNSGGTYGYSYPACGGGATDISTVTSSMSYSNGRTNRSSASLLARCIVAGGGAGGSYRRTTETITSESTTTVSSGTDTVISVAGGYRTEYITFYAEAGKTYTFNASPSPADYEWWGSSHGQIKYKKTITASYNETVYVRGWFQSSNLGDTVTMSVTTTETTTDTSTTEGYSNGNQQGGGTTGNGQYPGKQSSAGTGGGFGYGANQDASNYRYLGGAGGGGWYGGGTNESDSSTSYVNYSGGGSGFVNIAANATYQPSGYTGLQLDSGTTTSGSSSFESVSGGNETGHSGNGYARITVL